MLFLVNRLQPFRGIPDHLDLRVPKILLPILNLYAVCPDQMSITSSFSPEITRPNRSPTPYFAVKSLPNPPRSFAFTSTMQIEKIVRAGLMIKILVP